MATIREIQIDWTSPNTPGGTSVLYFESLTTPLLQRQDIFAFLSAINGYISVGTLASIRTEGREIDDETGTLVGVWAEPTPFEFAGTASGQEVPNASQLLLRFTTTAVVDGRLLKGRMFIPGYSTTFATDGQVSGDGQSVIGAAWQTEVIDAGNGHLVWSRPRPAREDPPLPARAGSSALTTGSTCWSEFAVLRRRR